MISQPGKQTIVITILTNISRSKSNHTIKFDKLIEYNMRNIFLEKTTQKNVVEKLFPNLSLKIKIEHISGSSRKFHVNCFYCMPS